MLLRAKGRNRCQVEDEIENASLVIVVVVAATANWLKLYPLFYYVLFLVSKLMNEKVSTYLLPRIVFLIL